MSANAGAHSVVLRHSSDDPGREILLRPVDPAGGIFGYRMGGREGELQASMNPAGGLLRIDGRVIPFHAARVERAILIWLKGRVHRLEFVDRSARRDTAAKSVATRLELIAPMPGTILKVRTAPGERFAAHQALVIMESMKMEMTLSIPHEGQVAAVLCREGQLVDMGAVLLKIAPPENTAETGEPISSAKAET